MQKLNTCRSVIFIIGFLLFSNLSFAQAPPQGFNYQAVARDGSGNLMQNAPVDIRVSIHKTNAGGTIVWQEEHTDTTNQFGLVNLVIGTGTKTGGSLANFSDINWKSDKYFLQVELDDGSGYTDMGTSQLISVPYAMVADKALVADSAVTGGSGGSSTVNTAARLAGDGSGGNPLDIAQQGAASGEVLEWNGSSWAPSQDDMTTDTSHWDKVGSDLYYSAGDVYLTTSSSNFFNVDNNGNNAGYRLYDGGIFQGALFYDPTPGVTYLSQSFSNYTLSFDGNDRVGIGTGTPGVDLDVQDSDGSGDAIIQIGGGTGDGVQFGSAEHIKDAGSNEIEVLGEFHPYVDGTYDLGNSSFRWQDVWASNGTIQTSDRRDKEDIQPLNYGLKEVMSLNPVQYRWKDRERRQYYVGLIAQDLQQVIPEVVKSKDIKIMEDGTKKTVETARLGVYYSHLIPVLVNAIQQQQTEIKEKEKKTKQQEQKIKEQEKQIAEQAKQIEQLQQQMKNIRSRLSELEE